MLKIFSPPTLSIYLLTFLWTFFCYSCICTMKHEKVKKTPHLKPINLWGQFFLKVEVSPLDCSEKWVSSNPLGLCLVLFEEMTTDSIWQWGSLTSKPGRMSSFDGETWKHRRGTMWHLFRSISSEVFVCIYKKMKILQYLNTLLYLISISVGQF